MDIGTHPITMRFPPPLASRAPGCTAPGGTTSPLYAAPLVGLRVHNGAAPETSERYMTVRRRVGPSSEDATAEWSAPYA